MAQGVMQVPPRDAAGTQPLPLYPQDTQEFLRCLMDQLHEELKEPEVTASLTGTPALPEALAVAVARGDSDSSDSDEKQEAETEAEDAEEEFLSCDSGSDRGEAADDAGRALSDKERRKARRMSWEAPDEDADVDTVAALDAQRPALRPASPCRTPGTDPSWTPPNSASPLSRVPAPLMDPGPAWGLQCGSTFCPPTRARQ